MMSGGNRYPRWLGGWLFIRLHCQLALNLTMPHWSIPVKDMAQARRSVVDSSEGLGLNEVTRVDMRAR